MQSTRPRQLALLTLLLALACPAAATANVPTCLGRAATIVHTAAGTVRGTPRADVIVTGAGADLVLGRGGNDRICSAGGEDRVLGGVGSDQVDAGAGDDVVAGGNGSDRVDGGGGDDTLVGNRGNDLLDGAAGRDFVAGSLGDDTLAGGPGAFDQVIGSIGNDKLDGGPGRGDSVRGDRGRDLLDGGPGPGDQVSYALSGESGSIVGGHGVLVDLASGRAANAGSDTLRGVEDVIGTAYADTIVAGPGPNGIYGGGGNDVLRGSGTDDLAAGGIGSDSCTGFGSESSCGPEAPVPFRRVEVDLAGGPASGALVAVYRQAEIPDAQTAQEDLLPTTVAASFESGAWVVRASLAVTAADRCLQVGPTEARCPLQGKPEALFLAGGRGDDRLEAGSSLPGYVSARLRGEAGNDTLVGGPGDDDLEGGILGESAAPQVLLGRGGDDALNYGDLIDGGGGSDLLLPVLCEGQRTVGGAGIDSVSFARESSGVQATLGGTIVFAAIRTERQFFPAGCGPNGVPGQIDDSVERIEGSPHDDVLIGDGGVNTLLGRRGDDRLLGRGGGDLLVGGEGRDSLLGESGFDRLYARDDVRDVKLDCGAPPNPGGVARTDPGDPARFCRQLR